MSFLLSRTIRLKQTKNGDDRVPMTQEVYTLLAALIAGRGPDEFVFTRKTATK